MAQEERSRLTLEQRVRPHPDVVDTTLDEGEVVLLHLESKIYYSLNLTGERIWQGLKQGLTLKEISRRLQEEFEVDADQADRSVLNLVNELCQQNLAQPETRSS
jgi:Coenzyme PQQ synthesis protein D (PqqD)